jgi:hypothetical protein
MNIRDILTLSDSEVASILDGKVSRWLEWEEKLAYWLSCHLFAWGMRVARFIVRRL